SGSKSHDYIPGYAPDLFDFIENNTHLYSDDFKERQLLANLVDTAIYLIAAVSADTDVKAAIVAKDPKATKAAAKKSFKDLTTQVESEPFLGFASAKTVDEITTRYRSKVSDEFKRRKFIQDRKDLIGTVDLVKLASMALLKKTFTTLETTDLVVAGFG